MLTVSDAILILLAEIFTTPLSPVPSGFPVIILISPVSAFGNKLPLTSAFAVEINKSPDEIAALVAGDRSNDPELLDKITLPPAYSPSILTSEAAPLNTVIPAC